MNTEIWLNKGIEFLFEYGPKVIGAIIVWIIGSWLISNIIKITSNTMEKRAYEPSLVNFLASLLNWGLKIALFVVLISQLGVETTSLAAIIGAAGLAIGLALQGSLANFAGGVLILIFKPFKVGDLIEAQGETGVVKLIEIFTTQISTPDNKLVIIPNGELSNGNIINYTSQGQLRVDLTAGVSYDADIKKTKEVLLSVMEKHEKVLKNPAPMVAVSELADSSVNFAVRPWCKSQDYWDVYFGITEDIKIALDAAGIEIPYPHQVEIQKKG